MHNLDATEGLLSVSSTLRVALHQIFDTLDYAAHEADTTAANEREESEQDACELGALVEGNAEAKDHSRDSGHSHTNLVSGSSLDGFDLLRNLGRHLRRLLLIIESSILPESSLEVRDANFVGKRVRETREEQELRGRDDRNSDRNVDLDYCAVLHAAHVKLLFVRGTFLGDLLVREARCSRYRDTFLELVTELSSIILLTAEVVDECGEYDEDHGQSGSEQESTDGRAVAHTLVCAVDLLANELTKRHRVTLEVGHLGERSHGRELLLLYFNLALQRLNVSSLELLGRTTKHALGNQLLARRVVVGLGV